MVNFFIEMSYGSLPIDDKDIEEAIRLGYKILAFTSSEDAPIQVNSVEQYEDILVEDMKRKKLIPDSFISSRPMNWEELVVTDEPPITSIKLENPEKLGFTDMVNSPNHYMGEQGLEVETVLQNFVPRYTNAYVAHRVSSAIEYLLRAPGKNKVEDLEKAKRNLQQALDYLDETGNKEV